MRDLIDFITNHVERGTCECGECVDAPDEPSQPEGHTADLYFFQVKAKNEPNVDDLRELIRNHRRGEFADVDLFDGKEHNYIELGGWIGDQGLAMMLMGLGHLLDLWRVITPRTLKIPEPLAGQMAGQGMISIVPLPKEKTDE